MKASIQATMPRFEVAYVLLTDLIITSALKAAVTLNFHSSILPTMEVGLRFGFVATFKQSW